MQQMLSANAAYLGISVSIILGFFGSSALIIYFFNVRPYQAKVKETSDELSLQKDTIDSLTDNNELLLKKLNDKSAEIDNKYSELADQVESLADSMKVTIETETKKLEVETAESIKKNSEKLSKLISDTENKTDLLSWETAWNMHYVWDAQKVHLNTVTSLLHSLKFAINLNESWKTGFVLKTLNEKISANITELKTLAKWEDVKKDILDTLNDIKDNDVLVKKITTRLSD